MDGVRPFALHHIPFVAFGGFMALAGVFGHKPIDPQAPGVAWEHSAHSAMATAAGTSISIGFIWQAVIQRLPLNRPATGHVQLSDPSRHSAAPHVRDGLCLAMALILVENLRQCVRSHKRHNEH
jgi:hypothetical protein